MSDTPRDADQGELSGAELDGVSGGAWNPFRKESWQPVADAFSDGAKKGDQAIDTAFNKLVNASDKVNGVIDRTQSGAGGRPGRPR